MSEVDALAQSWLIAAGQDLVAARATLARRKAFVPRHVCFTAQQAAEKAIKALAIVAQTEFPFVHDLPRLSAVLPPASRPSSPEVVRDLVELCTAVLPPRPLALRA